MAKQRAINEKQKKFCREYIKCHNGTKSAIKSGYAKKSAKQIACRMLTKDYIQEYIKKMLKKVISSDLMTAGEVVREMQRRATHNPADFYEVVAGETVAKPFDKLTADQKMLIKRIRIVGGKPELEFVDKDKNFEMLSKFNKLLTDKVEIEDTSTPKIDIDELSKQSASKAVEAYQKILNKKR